METVKVVFPDGKGRAMPANVRLVETKNGASRQWTELLEPIAHPQWRFVSMIGGWRAYPAEAQQPA